jgi:uncharacterized membrane protein YjfL (UPF0719 family)
MEIKLDAVLNGMLSSIVFTSVGIAFFVLSFVVIQKLLPFSVRKEIEEDQNIAVGIIVAALIIGIAMIVSAAVHG